ncbi:hypothetical protein BB934_38920 (plasmid) [Microvirga ossetica]|uniref:Uncharacterized protein n=1 Tax=Microvirga ossetica TaxID=1882682 RepID=A0A1B2EW71_9HYPH|nr:hypothetical protein BB934_38920 [Microvirga ossetica]
MHRVDAPMNGPSFRPAGFLKVRTRPGWRKEELPAGAFSFRFPPVLILDISGAPCGYSTQLR